jgi:SAM-dependent methyltransferase
LTAHISADGALLTSSQIQLAAHPIDPLAPCAPGRYADELVIVTREDVPGDVRGAAAPVVLTAHFVLRRRGRRVEVGHWLQPSELDNDLAGLLAEELFAPGWLSGAEIFERVFTGVVRSCVPGAVPAWLTFYTNTMDRIRECWRAPGRAGQVGTPINDFAAIYRRALRLIPPGRVLDVGSGFGFLPLLLARRRRGSVVAADLSPGSVRLLDSLAGALGSPLETLICDAAQVPLPASSVDTVAAIHVLEHLGPEHCDRAVQEAIRLARHRVVVAVPFEDEPTTAYGHLQSFSRADLVRLGRRQGLRFRVSEDHGGWLVLQTD